MITQYTVHDAALITWTRLSFDVDLGFKLCLLHIIGIWKRANYRDTFQTWNKFTENVPTSLYEEKHSMKM